MADEHLEGMALTIWQEVVVRGHHLNVTDGRNVRAVIVPYEDWRDMKERAG